VTQCVAAAAAAGLPRRARFFEISLFPLRFHINVRKCFLGRRRHISPSVSYFTLSNKFILNYMQ
jgi:hypothetical protein